VFTTCRNLASFFTRSRPERVQVVKTDERLTAAWDAATAAVLPAAFAIGERTAVDGGAVLSAAIAGFETVTRIGRAVTN